jgi:hypothetical protein
MKGISGVRNWERNYNRRDKLKECGRNTECDRSMKRMKLRNKEGAMDKILNKSDPIQFQWDFYASNNVICNIWSKWPNRSFRPHISEQRIPKKLKFMNYMQTLLNSIRLDLNCF